MQWDTLYGAQVASSTSPRTGIVSGSTGAQAAAATPRHPKARA